MGINPLYLAIHGHFYQPPRENPWMGKIEMQESAAPNHDWNERIADQCYSSNGASRILSSSGRIETIVNNYSYMSFNIGPTLMSWIREMRPDTYNKIREGDRLSMERLNGHGNAIAQVYNHVIMPLADLRDKLTQIRWGIQDFEYHFGRKPEGMWLAETAINMDTVVALIQEGIKFTILSPKQAQNFRTLTKKGSGSWTDCSGGNIDTTRPYRIIPRNKKGELLCEGYLDVFFYNADLSSAVGFEHLLRNASVFGNRILKAKDENKNTPQLISIGTDGESYGHHEPFGDMCAAWLFEKFCPSNNVVPVNYSWYLEKFPPEFEVELKNVYGEGSAWSCAHGVGRWYKDCGCSTGGGENWNQKWRTPLRAAFDRVKKVADSVFEREFATLSNLNCWEVRDNYIDVLVDPKNVQAREDFAKGVLKADSEDDKSVLFSLLEMQKFCLYSYTSCGWFFSDIEGLEPVQNMRYAARAMELLKKFLPSGHPIESEFLTVLSKAVSNARKMTGTEIFMEWVRPKLPIPYILIAAEAVKLHLELPNDSLSNVKISSAKRQPHQTILQATYMEPNTYESTDAWVMVITDSISRVKIAVFPIGQNSKSVPKFIDKDAIDTIDLNSLYPNAYTLRLHDLPPDILAEINSKISEIKLTAVVKDVLDFSDKFGVNTDSLIDKSGSLIEPLRQGILLNLSVRIRQLVLELLYDYSDAVFEKIKMLKDELKNLQVPACCFYLEPLFRQRLIKLVRKIQEMQNQNIDNVDEQRKLVDKLTKFIEVANWLELNVDKTYLENQCYDAYLLYKKNKGDSSHNALKSMFEWMNFQV